MSNCDLNNKTIVLGVSGGIAAFKAAELASVLVQRGANVHVVMTKNATHFVQPLTFAALTGRPVSEDMFQEQGVTNFDHITLTERASLVLIAPATANIIAKIAAGIADDLLTATVLATRAPVLIAPAMNTYMWENPATVANIQTLKSRGFQFVQPETGRLACGAVGAGRLARVENIIAAVERAIQRRSEFADTRVLVTAGATREPIDPARFISNYSTGRMGFAIAEAARDRGAQVTVLCGSVAIAPPFGVELVSTETTEAMCNAAQERFPQVDVAISAAAISDFRPAQPADTKLKKNAQAEGEMLLKVVPTRDLLAELAVQKEHQIVVGFAAETEDIIANAREKLVRKRLDLIVANNITQEGAGFAVETNIVTLIFPDTAPVRLPQMTKREVADKILDAIHLIRRKREETVSPA